MTLVANENDLPLRAAQEKIQAITGLLLGGFNRVLDSPLSWGLDGVDATAFGNLHGALSGDYQQAAQGFFGVATLASSAASFSQMISTATPLSSGFIAVGGQITDQRRSRLYMTVDLSEWVEFRNTDAVHLTFYDNTDRTPLGFSTVWLRAEAVVYHSRAKTARVYLQGQIANRLQSELIDVDPGSVRDVINRVLDVDSGRVYDSIHGPC